MSIQISIPEPCGQDWNGMEPVPGGRHCGLCRKTVVDFTRMTDAQLLDHFRQYATIPCGQFTSEQLDRSIKRVEAPRPRWGAAIAASVLLLLGLSKESRGQSKGDSTRIAYHYADANTPQPGGIKPHTPGNFDFYGILKDEKGNPVVNANVELMSDGITVARTLTDFDGVYQLSFSYSPHAAAYDMRFSYLGNVVTISGIPNRDAPVRVDGRISTTRPLSHAAIVHGGIPILLIDPPLPSANTSLKISEQDRIARRKETESNRRFLAEAERLQFRGNTGDTKHIIDTSGSNEMPSATVKPSFRKRISFWRKK